MNGWQEIIVSIFGITALSLFVLSYYQSRYKDNAYGSFYPLNIIGAFVWGDGVVFGVFWFVVSSIVIIREDWILFLLILSLFWLIRSGGEAIYQLLQQFSEKKRNSLDNYPRLMKVFHNDSIWFVYQIYWQCISVVTLLFSLYFATLWIRTI